MNNMKKLLLHSCCAPCTSGVLWQIINDYDITLLYYNPNINTLEEYNRRLDAYKLLLDAIKKEYHKDITLIAVPYNHNEFTTLTTGLENEPEGGKRCSICFALRLDYTAKYALDNGFDIFATTLTVSPHKDYNVINKIGDELSKKYGIEYLPSNFKKNDGFLKSISNSKAYGLYRQTFCGCKENRDI